MEETRYRLESVAQAVTWNQVNKAIALGRPGPYNLTTMGEDFANFTPFLSITWQLLCAPLSQLLWVEGRITRLRLVSVSQGLDPEWEHSIFCSSIPERSPAQTSRQHLQHYVGIFCLVFLFHACLCSSWWQFYIWFISASSIPSTVSGSQWTTSEWVPTEWMNGQIHK